MVQPKFNKTSMSFFNAASSQVSSDFSEDETYRNHLDSVRSHKSHFRTLRGPVKPTINLSGDFLAKLGQLGQNQPKANYLPTINHPLSPQFNKSPLRARAGMDKTQNGQDSAMHAVGSSTFHSSERSKMTGPMDLRYARFQQ